jgi:hypothetical protein
MSKFANCAGLGAAALTLGALLNSAVDNFESLAISRNSRPDVVEVKTPPVENHYDASVASRFSGVPIPVEGTKVWEFSDHNGKLVAVPQRQVPKLSEGDFVTIEQRMPGRPYQALEARKN